MKKVLLSLFLPMLALGAFAQDLKPVKIDDQLTISMPAGYTEKDTLDQKTFSGNGSFGYMIAIRQANAKNNTPLKKEKDLNNVMKNYIDGIKAQSGGGSLNNVRDTTIKGLEAKVFTLQRDAGSEGVVNTDFALIYTKDVTYTFEYVYPDTRKDMVKPEIKAFFSSIKTSNELQPNDQYITAGQPQGMPSGEKIALIGGGAMVIVLIFYFAFRKKERIAGV